MVSQSSRSAERVCAFKHGAAALHQPVHRLCWHCCRHQQLCSSLDRRSLLPAGRHISLALTLGDAGIHSSICHHHERHIWEPICWSAACAAGPLFPVQAGKQLGCNGTLTMAISEAWLSGLRGCFNAAEPSGFVQAGEQLGPDWTLMKAGTEGCPEIPQWLASNVPEPGRVGIDPYLHTVSP